MRTKAEARKKPIDGETWADGRGAVYAVFNVGYQIRLELQKRGKKPWLGSNLRFMAGPTWWKWTARAEYLGGANE